MTVVSCGGRFFKARMFWSSLQGFRCFRSPQTLTSFNLHAWLDSHSEPNEAPSARRFRPVCQQEKHEIISLFLFIAERIKVGGMIGWRIRLFSLFKSMHKNGQRIKSLFRSFGRVYRDYLLKYWQFKTDHFLQEKNSWLECCRWVCVIRETLHLIL